MYVNSALCLHIVKGQHSVVRNACNVEMDKAVGPC